MTIVFVEGEVDFLVWALKYDDAALLAPAVYGIWSGSWCWEMANRIRDDSEVVLRTDRGDPGDKYAEEIGDTLIDRCRVLRWKGFNNERQN